ncbi:hypothetical protein BDR06DRAFT_971267 [Suillus hirtellus]|nr:hypothetical protein BDR06DRAFT_971267 [Suillus hirtellus]
MNNKGHTHSHHLHSQPKTIATPTYDNKETSVNGTGHCMMAPIDRSEPVVACSVRRWKPLPGDLCTLRYSFTPETQTPDDKLHGENTQSLTSIKASKALERIVFHNLTLEFQKMSSLFQSTKNAGPYFGPVNIIKQTSSLSQSIENIGPYFGPVNVVQRRRNNQEVNDICLLFNPCQGHLGGKMPDSFDQSDIMIIGGMKGNTTGFVIAWTNDCPHKPTRNPAIQFDHGGTHTTTR